MCAVIQTSSSRKHHRKDSQCHGKWTHLRIWKKPLNSIKNHRTVKWTMKTWTMMTWTATTESSARRFHVINNLHIPSFVRKHRKCHKPLYLCIVSTAKKWRIHSLQWIQLVSRFRKLSIHGSLWALGDLYAALQRGAFRHQLQGRNMNTGLEKFVSCVKFRMKKIGCQRNQLKIQIWR